MVVFFDVPFFDDFRQMQQRIKKVGNFF